MQKSAPFWDHPVTQFGDTDALLGSMLKSLSSVRVSEMDCPSGLKNEFAAFLLSVYAREQAEDNHSQQRLLAWDNVCKPKSREPRE